MLMDQYRMLGYVANDGIPSDKLDYLYTIQIHHVH